CPTVPTTTPTTIPTTIPTTTTTTIPTTTQALCVKGPRARRKYQCDRELRSPARRAPHATTPGGAAMSRHSFAAILLGLGLAPSPLALEPAGKDVFGYSGVLPIPLKIPAKEYEGMQPPPGGFGMPGAPPATQAPKGPAEKRDSERNLFGTEFRWARGDVTA